MQANRPELRTVRLQGRLLQKTVQRPKQTVQTSPFYAYNPRSVNRD